MKIIPITIEDGPLDRYPCINCDEKAVKFIATIEHKGEKMNLCLCPVCAKLSEEKLIEKILEYQVPADMVPYNNCRRHSA